MNHSMLNAYAGPATVLALGFLSAPLLAQSITVVSWGGSYARASQEAYHKPFTEETGIEIRLEDYNGGLAQIRAQVESGVVHWDVVDLELADAMRGCDEGLFELIDAADLPPGADGSSPEEDYYPDTLSECGAGTLFYATVYAYNSEVISGETPETIGDFFDLERFPGRRGMRRSPLVNLEFALMADGVAIEDVYAVLDTEEGLARAFRKLDTIKDRVVWWEAGAQPPQMLADGEVVMTTAYNGRVFNAQVLEDQPFVIVWDGQVLDSGPMGIVAGTPGLPRRYSSCTLSRDRPPWPGSASTLPTARSAGPPTPWYRRTSRPAWKCGRTCPIRRSTPNVPCETIGRGGATTAMK